MLGGIASVAITATGTADMVLWLWLITGNSIPDLMNNLSLARDGFPSMAVAACFAGPMFGMMVGMSSALAYGAAVNHGMLQVPVVS